jgi:hypothetical protein
MHLLGGERELTDRATRKSISWALPIVRSEPQIQRESGCKKQIMRSFLGGGRKLQIWVVRKKNCK